MHRRAFLGLALLFACSDDPPRCGDPDIAACPFGYMCVDGPAGAGCAPVQLSELCGGSENVACAQARPCLLGLPGLPADTGVCGRAPGERCEMSGQCGDAVCNPFSGICQPGCDVTGDCAEGACVYLGATVGGVCEPTSIDCSSNEIVVGGACTGERPCARESDGSSSCGADQVCVEIFGGPAGTFCRQGCQSASDCEAGQTCGAHPIRAADGLYCTTPATNGCRCGPGEWCALDTQTCRTERPCYADTDCEAGQVCGETLGCTTVCQTNADCPGQACVVGSGERRVCATVSVCNCREEEYCRFLGVTYCLSDDTPPCSLANQNCPSGQICDPQLLACLRTCTLTSDCEADELCAALDGNDRVRACRAPIGDEPHCTANHFLYAGRCNRAAEPACTTNVGCPQGYACAPYSVAGHQCTCTDLSLCTRCSSNDDCPNGATCEGGTCDWDTCADGVCPAGQTCAHWLARSEPPVAYGGVIYPGEPICVRPGAGSIGTRCAASSDCESLVCANEVCAERCAITSDCEAGQTCVLREPWLGPQIGYCANQACGDRCRSNEVCIPQDNRCSYQPCGPDNVCPADTVCSLWANTCNPICAGSGECPATETCALLPAEEPETFCYPTQFTGCANGCSSNERCVNSVCTTLALCENGACGAGFFCAADGLCRPTCDASSDCAANETCVFDSGLGVAQCDAGTTNCACPRDLVCMDRFGGRCGAVTTCTNSTQCNTLGGDGNDYSCDNVGGTNYCICGDRTSTECMACNGNSGYCGMGLACLPSGACGEVACDIVAPATCPSGTVCIFNFPTSYCWVPFANRPAGAACNGHAECETGLCDFGGGARCAEPCRTTGDCSAGNCNRGPSDVFGVCGATSPCAVCPAGQACNRDSGSCQTF